MKIEQCSGAEIDAVMTIISEASPNQIHVGAPCANPQNQVFTVIGFSEIDYNQAKQKPQNFTFGMHFDPSGNRKIVYGLYFDPSNPERQEIIDCKARECKFVRELNDAVLLTSAKASPFLDADVMKHFMKILQGTIKNEQEFVQSILRNYIVRAINNMIQILHNQYTSFLAASGISRDLFALVLEGSSQDTQRKISKIETTMTLCELRLDQMRLKGLTSDSSLIKSTPHKFQIGSTPDDVMIIIEESKSAKCMKLRPLKFCGFEQDKIVKLPVTTLKVASQIDLKRTSKNSILLLDGESLNARDKQTQKALAAVTYVITDSKFNFPNFVTMLEAADENDKAMKKSIANTSFIMVNDDAFTTLYGTVTSASSNLVESLGEEALAGFEEDQVTRALSKLIGAKVGPVTSNLKDLISLKCGENDESAFDIIEKKVLEVLKDNLSNEVFEKKKKEFQ